jgi:hypothetical protein
MKHNKIIIKSLILAIAGLFLLSGCTENVRARNYGGTMTVDLPPNTTLVNATFKEVNLWYLTRPRNTNDVVTTWTFKEKSNFGLQEGTIIFVEH